MENGKTTKYLKYAIGEIVLVVIGILIALQINNWNEKRINNNKLCDYLFGIIDDLKLDIEAFNDEIYYATRSNERTKLFLAHTDYTSFTLDSLEQRLETHYSLLPLNRSTFSKIENSGITDFGKYEGLMKELDEYYNYIIPDMTRMVASDHKAVDHEDAFWRYTQTKYEFSYNDSLVSYQNEDDAKTELIQLLKSPTARNILKINYRRKAAMIRRLEGLKEDVPKLITSIEDALKD